MPAPHRRSFGGPSTTAWLFYPMEKNRRGTSRGRRAESWTGAYLPPHTDVTAQTFRGSPKNQRRVASSDLSDLKHFSPAALSFSCNVQDTRRFWNILAQISAIPFRR